MASSKRQRQRAHRIVAEAAITATEVQSDTVDLAEATIRPDGTMAIRLINPGWGSSGYYSADALEAAGTARVFPRGTQMYLDHPGVTEKMDRPERSVRDLAGVLETDATWRNDPKGGPGLYAEAKIFEAWRDVLAELAPYIGISIRAAAEVAPGEAEGKRGPIVERLVEGASVDFVTKAGRGGQVMAVLESMRPQATEAGLYSDDLRDRLRTTLGERFTAGQDAWCYVRDFNDENVVFELYGDDVDTPGTFQLAYQLDGDQVVLDDGDPTEVKVTTTYTPVTTQTTTEESEMTPEEIREAVATAVKAEVAPIKTELDETKTKLEATEAELAEAKTANQRANEVLLVNEATARVAAHEKVKALPAVARDRIVTQLAHEAKAGDDGKLDVAALDAATTAAVEAEVTYLAEATGSPVTGVGGGPAGGNEAVEAARTRLEDTFKSLGLSETAAKVAVGGRS